MVNRNNGFQGRAATICRLCRQKSIIKIVDNEFHCRQLSPDVFFQRSEASHFNTISAERQQVNKNGGVLYSSYANKTSGLFAWIRQIKRSLARFAKQTLSFKKWGKNACIQFSFLNCLFSFHSFKTDSKSCVVNMFNTV